MLIPLQIANHLQEKSLVAIEKWLIIHQELLLLNLENCNALRDLPSNGKIMRKEGKY